MLILRKRSAIRQEQEHPQLQPSPGRESEHEKLPEQQVLLDELAAAKAGLTAARSAFEQATEPELIEAAVFELGALEARYRFFLRRLRELDARASPRFRPTPPAVEPMEARP